jgi:hypothetical protein
MGKHMVGEVLHEHFRLPACFTGELSSDPGALSTLRPRSLREGIEWVEFQDPGCSQLKSPVDPTELLDYFRSERYVRRLPHGLRRIGNHTSARGAYYTIRPLMPAWSRRLIQRAYFSDWKKLPFPGWPVDSTVDSLHDELLGRLMIAAGTRRVPFIWFWPDAATSCLMMTHDVETSIGRDNLPALMDLDDAYGIKASFQLVPEGRYDFAEKHVQEIRRRGFEFNLHDLNHDGRLFEDRKEFLRRAKKINEYAQRYCARGFRAACMYRNQDWFEAFRFSYDMTVPNVAHLDPQRGGCCTTMPYFIGDLLELPLTATQDYSLFHILNTYSLDLWRKQINLICRRNGLISFNVHPDYLVERRPRRIYEGLLDCLRQKVEGENIWAALPGDVDSWWRARNQMSLEDRGDGWEIVGVGSERARLAHAVLDDTGRLSYEVNHIQAVSRPHLEPRAPGPTLPLAH